MSCNSLPNCAELAFSHNVEVAVLPYAGRSGVEEPLPPKKDVQGLFNAVKRPLGLSPDRVTLVPESLMMCVLPSAASTVIQGIGALHTHTGDAHGRERGYTRVDARISRPDFDGDSRFQASRLNWQEETVWHNQWASIHFIDRIVKTDVNLRIGRHSHDKLRRNFDPPVADNHCQVAKSVRDDSICTHAIVPCTAFDRIPLVRRCRRKRGTETGSPQQGGNCWSSHEKVHGSTLEQ